MQRINNLGFSARFARARNGGRKVTDRSYQSSGSGYKPLCLCALRGGEG